VVVCLAALTLRAGAAVAVDVAVRGQGETFVFGDSEGYWRLATTILQGRPYQVYGRPAMRTPGYPGFLAAAMWVGGRHTLAVRLVQAIVSALAPLLVYVLARRWVDAKAALVSALICAVYHYFIAISTFVLTESLFPTLMLGVLVGLAGLSAKVRPWLAVGTGILTGATVLVRPSFLLYVPFWGAASLVFGHRRRAVAANLAIALALTGATMAPWVVRNCLVTGHFVPTSTTVGVTLYDGLSPSATGASDQRFTLDPQWYELSHIEKDRTWRRLAVQWAWRNPFRFLELAAIKFARFWSPWPNAAVFSAWPIKLGAAAAMIPMVVLVVIGLARWPAGQRRQGLFLLGPVLYFCLLHMVVVSSIRYRVPAMVPSAVLAAVGLCVLLGRGNWVRTTPTPGR